MQFFNLLWMHPLTLLDSESFFDRRDFEGTMFLVFPY